MQADEHEVEQAREDAPEQAQIEYMDEATFAAARAAVLTEYGDVFRRLADA